MLTFHYVVETFLRMMMDENRTIKKIPLDNSIIINKIYINNYLTEQNTEQTLRDL